jgi:hypothetical protein
VAKLDESNALMLAGRLFESSERWGWQYVDPGAVRPSPDLASEPGWVDPPPPDLRGIHARQAFLRRKLRWRVVIAIGLFVFGLVIIKFGGVLICLMALALVAGWLFPLLRTNRRARAVQDNYGRDRQEQWTRFSQAHERWRGAVAHWDSTEQTRRNSADLWYPLELRSSPQRVDVFGGTPDGWSALLCTVGTTIMESGAPMFVVDLTEEDVSGPLCEVSRLRGLPTQRQSVPANLEAARLLEGLQPEQVAELIAESVDTMRGGGEDVVLRMLDVELILNVVSRFDGPVSFGRIAAGLLVLQQGYDIDRDDRLTAREFRGITEVVDTVAATERVQNELQFLRAVLEMVTPAGLGDIADAADTAEIAEIEESIPAGLWPATGVCVLRTDDDNRRRRDFVDRLMAQLLLRKVRQVRNQNLGFVLVLAGADHLGHETLELLAQRCRQAGIRLILFMEHLRGDLQQLLGGSDSVTFIMRLGNAQEAAAAAEHIGRGHKFLLSQLSRQSGATDTSGSSYTTGTSSSSATSTSSGTTQSYGRSTSWLDTPSISTQHNESTTVTTGDSTQWGTNESRAISSTDGETVSRVYEFTVEPTQIQSLDPTSFLFVESFDGQRRIVAGGCDPHIVMLPRVSRTPVGVASTTPALPHGPQPDSAQVGGGRATAGRLGPGQPDWHPTYHQQPDQQPPPDQQQPPPRQSRR